MNTTAIILNWNTANVALRSLERLVDEVPVIFVENGSEADERELVREVIGTPWQPKREGVIPMEFEFNVGNSISRNRAIDRVDTKYFFLIDGDILYVPGSIEVLVKMAENLEDFGIIGVHNLNVMLQYGHNGTPFLDDADDSFATRKVKDVSMGVDWPIAWSQYGLFLKTDQRFPEQPPFDVPGHGSEDDWYFYEMRERGLHSYYIDQPLYYHEAHSSWRCFEAKGWPNHTKDRLRALRARFHTIFADPDAPAED